MRSLFATVAVVALLTGCYKATIHVKPPQPATPSTTVRNQMHLSALGIFELSSPVNMENACPHAGTARIDERVSVVGGIVNMILGRFIPILHVVNPTAMCGAPAPVQAAPPVPAPGAY